MNKRITAFLTAFLLSLNNLCFAADTEVTISVTLDMTGHIFSDNEEINFAVDVDGISGVYTTEYRATYDDTGEDVWTGTDSELYKTNSGSVTVPVNKNGGYHLYVELKNSDGATIGEGETVFSRVMSGEQNAKLAANAHFAQHYGNFRSSIDDTLKLMKKANIGGYRDHPAGWEEVEYKQGYFKDVTDAAWYPNIVRNTSEKYGVTNSQSTVAFGNRFYTAREEDGDDMLAKAYTHPPTSGAALNRWGEFCVYMIKLMNVPRAELWNEPDMANYASPKEYVDLAKAGISAIRDDPATKDTKIGLVSLGGSTVYTCDDPDNCDNDTKEHYGECGRCYFSDMVKQGLLELDFDALTLHFYRADDPIVKDSIKYWRDYLDSHGREDVEIWITEYGYFTGNAVGSVTEEQQARIITREYIVLNSEGLVENMTIYDIADDTFPNETYEYSSTYSERNLGILRAFDEKHAATVPLSAKKSYIAVAAMNAILGGAKAGKTGASRNIDEYATVCEFEHTDGDKILAFWSDYRRDMTIKCTAPSLEYYDVYGNKTVLESNNGEFNICSSADVGYIKGGFDDYAIEMGNTAYIGNVNELVAFRNIVNHEKPSLCGKLTADIDLSNLNWNPIGGKSEEWMYQGTFDGNGHTVTVNIDQSGNQWGFFADVGNATIKNLTVRGSVKGSAFVGGIAAYVRKASTFENCANYATVTATGNDGRAGGLIGFSDEYTTILKNCYNCGEITAPTDAYGLTSRATITNCYNSGTVTATATAGYASADCDGNSTATNSYYLAGCSKNARGTSQTAEQFASGEVAIALGNAYGQRIGVDETPCFANDDNYLYKTEGGGYTSSHPNAHIIVESDRIRILSPKAISGTLVIARYSGSVLQGIATCSAATTERTEWVKEYQIKSGGSNDKQIDTVKAFLWNDTENIKPLIGRIEPYKTEQE